MRNLRLIVTVLAFVIGSAAPSAAQTVITKPGALLVWDQPVAPGETILPSAYEYRLKVDALAPVVVKAVCTAPTAPETTWVCETPLPPLATGSHSITITAGVTINGQSYQTPEAAPLKAVSIVIILPENLRVKEGGSE